MKEPNMAESRSRALSETHPSAIRVPSRSTVPEKLVRVRLTQQIYKVLREKILARELLPGERIDIAVLAKQLGVSRTPVKEAVNQLADQGIVEIRPQRGTFVASVDWHALKELHELCLILETSVCGALAGKLSLHNLAELRDLLTEMEGKTDGPVYRDYTEYLKLDRDYHTAIVRFTGNVHLLRTYERLGLHLRVARDFADVSHITGAADNLAEHVEIFRTLAAGDANQARRAAAEHLRNGFRRVCGRLNVEFDGLMFDLDAAN
jgi:DNA-binding GntR family transcriptional regulator